MTEFYNKIKEFLGESFKDLKLSGMEEGKKNNTLLFLFLYKKITGSTVVCSLKNYDVSK